MTPLKTVTIITLLIAALALVAAKPAEQSVNTGEQGDDNTGVTVDSAVVASSPAPSSLQCSGPTSSECENKGKETVANHQHVDNDNEEMTETLEEHKKQTVDNDDDGQAETNIEQKQLTVDEDDEGQTAIQTEQKVNMDDEDIQIEQKVNMADKDIQIDQKVDMDDEETQTEQKQQNVDKDSEKQKQQTVIRNEETQTEQNVHKNDEEETQTEQKQQNVEKEKQTETHTGVMLATDSSKTDKLASNPGPISFQCSGSTSSSCDGKLCTVLCSDGHKVQLHCEDEGINVYSNLVGGLSHIQVSCGKKVQFRPCFPFCQGKQTVDTEDNQHQNVETGDQSRINPFGGSLASSFASPSPNDNFNQFGNFNPFAR